MKHLTRRPIFWFIAFALFITSISFVAFYFPKAIPMLDIRIQMSRNQALSKAKQLAHQYNLYTDNAHSAALFNSDSLLQAYVELEAGGKKTWADLLKNKLYVPYQWQVRLFQEGKPEEASLFFTPEGEPYGFNLTLSENTLLPNLSPQEARTLAEKEALSSWQLDMSRYQLVTSSQDKNPSGRLDQVFTYELPHQQLGTAKYRVQLKVSGNRLTALNHSVETPEAFVRRYQEMRASNVGIATAGNIAFTLLYLIGGCLIGLAIMLKKRWLLWKEPFLFSVSLSLLIFLANLNNFPSLWMDYNTAISRPIFVIQNILQMLLGTCTSMFFFFVVFMTAEGLTRRAFPQQIQLWKVWSKGTANSDSILGQSTGGILVSGFHLFYVVAFYWFTTRLFGWWSPSETLTDPNILASYLPALGPISQAAQAGILEECLFRAIPLAGAALLGQRFGKPLLWIGGAFILQALIFGSLHATYPNFPSYSRPIELLVPSFIFGALYLYFGLLPGIIAHFSYDLALMSMPVFMSSGGFLWFNRALVLLAAILPLLVIAWRFYSTKIWKSGLESPRNFSWQPIPKIPVLRSFASTLPPLQISQKMLIIVSVLMVGSLGIWLKTTSFSADAPSIQISRLQARQIAQNALQQRGITIDKSWTIASSTYDEVNSNENYVWQAGGPKLFHQLIGSYIVPPSFQIRFAHFEGSQETRAEQYFVTLNGTGDVTRILHTFPENLNLPSLEAPAAKQLALQTLQSEFHLEGSQLQEISAIPKKQPHRVDWYFTFSDKKAWPLKEGNAYISVTLAGNQVSDYSRYVFIPEDWSRKQDNEQALLGFFNQGRTALLYAFILFSIIAAIIAWSQKRFSIKACLHLFWVRLLIAVLLIAMSFPMVLSGLSTSQPFGNQLGIFFGNAILTSLLVSLQISLLGGMLLYKAQGRSLLRTPRAIILTLLLGFFLAGVVHWPALLDHTEAPIVPDFSFMASYAPIASIAFAAVAAFMRLCFLLATLFLIVDYFQHKSSRLSWIIYPFICMLCIAFLGSNANSIVYPSLQGVSLGIGFIFCYHMLLRYDMGLLPLLLVAESLLPDIRDFLVTSTLTTGAGITLGFLCKLVFAYIWYKASALPREQKAVSA